MKEHVSFQDFCPSPDSCWARSAFAAMQEVEPKWQMLNKVNKWFRSSHVKFPFVKMSASWFLVSTCLIWIFGSRLIRSNNLSRATRWVRETHVSLLDFFFSQSFWSQPHCPQTHTIKLDDFRIEHLRDKNQCHVQHRFYYEIYFSHSQAAPCYLKHEKHFQEQK